MQTSILYTANIDGDLNLLPRLYNFLLTLRRAEHGRVLVVDTGAACVASAWHCAITGGRSILLVLDAMGYDAANASGYLTDEGYARLQDNLLQMAVLRAGSTHLLDETLGLTTAPQPAQAYLQVDLRIQLQTALHGHTLTLQAVPKGAVGLVRLAHMSYNGRLTVTHSSIQTMPPTTHPDPTIAGTVDFVLGEARYYQQRRGDSPG